MNKKLKRFFYYWRLPLLFFILFFVLLELGISLEGDAGGVVSAFWLFVDIPCLIFFTVRAIFFRIRSAVTYRRTGVRDEAFIFPEIDAVQMAADAVSDEIDSVKRLSPGMKLRFFAFRLLGAGLIAGGSVGCFVFSSSILIITLFTLVIIGGATLWICANPKTYNDQVEGVRMVPCPDNLTAERLYLFLKAIPTSLGSPRFASVRGFKKPVMVYGPGPDDDVYLVYHAPLSDFFYVSATFSAFLKEELPPIEAMTDENGDTIFRDSDDQLDEITRAVEQAVERAARS